MNIDEAPIISLSGVSKKFIVHHEKPTLIDFLAHKNKETFYALKDINLQIYSGDKVGLIGVNGSGKTTLLKVISKITTPTEGKVNVEGRVISLIDLDAGFQSDFTGIQNIYLNGLILGMKKEEISKKINSIVEFSGIKKFIDTPLFTYSSGMVLRLGFSIAVFAEPEILILDESMAVGDEEFQKKSEKKINEFFQMGKTIIVATHWMDYVRRNCNRVVLIDKGKIISDGSKEVIDRYLNEY